MDDFEYLSESRVDAETTATFEFDNVRGRPRFVCAPATGANRGYWNALLREVESAPRAKKGGKGARAKPRSLGEVLEMSESEQEALLAANRLRDARLYAQHCVRSWDRAPILRVEKDGKGGEKPIPAVFSPESTRGFLENLAKHAPHVFDAFRAWVTDNASFERMSFEAVEELSGN